MVIEHSRANLPVKGVILDLDDTLYLEKEYVYSGFTAVANYISRDFEESEKFRLFMEDSFTSKNDGLIFNRLISQFEGIEEKFSLSDLVHFYRNHHPRLNLKPEWNSRLTSWRKEGLFIGLISDGLLNGQKLKVDALGLNELTDLVILTDQYGTEFWKPHPRSFMYVEEVTGLHGQELVYIGDNVIKDFLAPNQLGWLSIRLRVKGQIRERLEAQSINHSATVEVGNSYELDRLIASWM